MSNLKAEGKCLFCNKLFSSQGIGRHLSGHLKQTSKKKLSEDLSYHIKITGEKHYFLHLLISGKTTLEVLDTYLKNIWLECCGHLSSFEIKGSYLKKNWFFEEIEEDEFGISLEMRIEDLFKKGMELNYEYDFGSTTKLVIKVVNEYLIKESENILLLSRNEPLKIICDLCKKQPARSICLLWHSGATMFCESCKEIHAKKCDEFIEYSEGTIVNSPRMGVCGYNGGIIDVERDGVWQK